MSAFYSLAYAVGFTPWEKAGQADADGLARMLAREEAEHGGPGKALDLGCGSGLHLVTLARRGWTVTGVDLVDRALARARTRAAASGVAATVVHADVTALAADTVGDGFDLFLDVGCFHGLTGTERSAMARAVTGVAAPGATMLMLAFGRASGPRFLPQGATRADIEKAYQAWQVVDVMPVPADTPGLPRVAARSEPTFYRLRRR